MCEKHTTVDMMLTSFSFVAPLSYVPRNNVMGARDENRSGCSFHTAGGVQRPSDRSHHHGGDFASTSGPPGPRRARQALPGASQVGPPALSCAGGGAVRRRRRKAAQCERQLRPAAPKKTRWARANAMHTGAVYFYR